MPSKQKRSDYYVRAVNIEDGEVWETILGLHKKCFIDNSPLPHRMGVWWICFYHDDPVGFAGMIHSNQGKDNGYLYRFGVIPGHRGLGLQRRLTYVVEKCARKMGLGWLVTDTNHNPPSANSFIKCGYQTYTPEKPWSFASATYWRKKLREEAEDLT